jgi:ABC-2 type transport system permease protein
MLPAQTQSRLHLRPYLALVRLAFHKQFAYRAANLAGFVTNSFFSLLRAAVVIALYNAQPDGATVGGFSLRDAVTYTGIGQALIGWVALWGWWDILLAVKSGEVATDLQRPIGFFWYWCAQDFGRACAQLIMRGLPIMALYAALYPITWPGSLVQVLGFLMALLLAWFISFAWRFLYSIAAFWTTDAKGFGRMASFLAIFASGFIMPVGFFPDWVQGALRALPWSAMVNTPVEAFVNVVTGDGLVLAIAQQAFWAAALCLLAHGLLHAGSRKLAVDGG